MAWLEWFARRGGGVAVSPPPPRSGGKDDPKGALTPWQKQAWGYYKLLGEIHYAAGFYARMLGGVRLYCEIRDEQGDWVEIEDADNPYAAQLERLENSRGGMAAIQGSYGTLTFVQGESMLACTLESLGEDDAGNPYLDPDGLPYAECWEMLSAAELTYSKTNREYKRLRGGEGAGSAETIPETDPEDPQPGTMIAYRFYHRDPEFSGRSDSSMRAVLADCEELLLLKQAIRNTARNRGAGNGVLILPSQLGGNEIDQGDGVMVPKNAKAIYDALTVPIQNEQAASAVTPVILFGNDVTSQNAFHLDLRGAALYKETGLRDECIRRIAIGLDMPPENLLGTAGVNHWTAWQIDEAAWKNHGANVARELVEQLTAALLAPLAIQLGEDPRNVRVWYDPTDVVEDPDRGRAAMEAHDRLIISDDAARRDLGFDQDDAPSMEEWQARAAIGSRSTTNVSNPTRSIPKQGGATVTPERVIGMAEAAVLRCRELAGSRLRTRMNGDAPANLRVRIKNAQNADVACKLAPEIRDDYDPDTLVAGAGQVFLSGMRRMGLDPGLAESLVRRVEEHAARTLFDDDPGDLPEEVLAICGLVSLRL